MSKKLATEEFIKQSVKVHGDSLLLAMLEIASKFIYVTDIKE